MSKQDCRGVVAGHQFRVGEERKEISMMLIQMSVEKRLRMIMCLTPKASNIKGGDGLAKCALIVVWVDAY